MRFFADNSDYRQAIRDGGAKMPEPNPITYRMLHEEAAGMGLCAEFFQISGINPDAPVVCNCKFDQGHEPTCDLVSANDLRRERALL